MALCKHYPYIGFYTRLGFDYLIPIAFNPYRLELIPVLTIIVFFILNFPSVAFEAHIA